VQNTKKYRHFLGQVCIPPCQTAPKDVPYPDGSRIHKTVNAGEAERGVGVGIKKEMKKRKGIGKKKKKG